MTKNNYQRMLENIHTPAGLNDRVLRAAGQRADRRAPAAGRRRPALRAAVCAACALALVLGTVQLRPADPARDSGGEPVRGDGAPVSVVPGFSFGLTAYAAGGDEIYVPGPNSGIALRAGEGCVTLDGGNYTGLLFRITGERIETVSLSIDRGGLYRYRLHEDLTDEEIASFRQAMEDGTLATAAISQTDGGMWYMPEMILLGESVREDYDPEVSYGFWLSPEEMTTGSGLGMTVEEQADIDFFDGAVLTVTAVFAGGSEQTKTYRLSSGPLKVESYITGGLTLLPQLAGDDEPYVYGLYATDVDNSRWLRWPVEGANTVSTSYPFGSWDKVFVNVDEDGEEVVEERTVTHNGIDIPAEAGTPILAALDGTVAETGFDEERGNYLVLDHGDGLETVYAACQEITARQGDAVAAGQEIALVGKTGPSTGPHLCFQVWEEGEAQNPVAYFDSVVRDTLRMG